MSITLATKLKYTGYETKRKLANVTETMVYVPILETLQHILKNDAVLAEVCINKCSCHSVSCMESFHRFFAMLCLAGKLFLLEVVCEGRLELGRRKVIRVPSHPPPLQTSSV